MTEAEIMAEHVHNTKVLILNELKDRTGIPDSGLPQAEKILRYALNAMAAMIVNDINTTPKKSAYELLAAHLGLTETGHNVWTNEWNERYALTKYGFVRYGIKKP